jgi:preprotein translocase subunit SecF
VTGTVTYAETPQHPGKGGRRHRFADLYHERTNYQFIDRSWRWLLLSGSLIVISLLALVFSGLNLGIDFEGGTQWQFTVSGKAASTDDVRSVMDSVGQPNTKVLILGRSGVRVQAEELKPKQRDAITAALARYAGIDESDVSVTNVGPTWGNRVSKKAIQALVVFFILIAVYLSIRFEWRMALAAIIAVIHDIIITAGVYAITGFEVTPATVVAFLTILGFSLYDTVVVFDKVKENEAHLAGMRGYTYSMMVNRSLNQVLMRSLNTSFVAVLPVVSLLVVGRFGLGAVGLQDFALALFVGLLTGAYSSIFVATPIVAWLKEREPKYVAVRDRSAQYLAREAAHSDAPEAVAALAVDELGLDTDTAFADVEDALDEAEDEGDEDAVVVEETPRAKPAPAAPRATARPPAAPAPTPRPTPGVQPRGRQQRRKKRR